MSGLKAAVRVIDGLSPKAFNVVGLGFVRAVPAGYGSTPVMTRAIFLSSTSMDTSTRCAPAASWNAKWPAVMLSSCGLLRRLAPDFKTICGLPAGKKRAGNRGDVPGIRVCSAASRDCSLPDWFALDGSKFRAAGGARSGLWASGTSPEEAARIDQRIAGYLADLDATDATETDDADAGAHGGGAGGAQGAGGLNWPRWRRCWARNTAQTLVEGRA